MRRVGEGVPEPARDGGFDLERLTDRTAQQVFHADDELADVDDLRLEFLAPAERQQLARQLGAAPHRGLRTRNAPLECLVTGNALADEVQVARDHLQQVVEVVRDAAGKLANRLHLLRLAQLLLRGLKVGGGLLLGRHVAATGVDQPLLGPRDPRDPPVAAVVVAHAVVLAGQQAVGRGGQSAAAGVGFVGVVEFEVAAADHLVRQPAQDRCPGFVGGADHAISIDHDLQVARVLPGAVALARAFFDAGFERGVEESVQ